MRMLRRPEKIMDEEAEVLSSDFVFSLRDNNKLSGGVSRPLERRVRRSVLLYAEPPNNELTGRAIALSG
ncbi:MAG: hypothetical protein BWK80_27700 [Desulfobacteraceae bacterium IS3]|nr:MAG: hypothetical protein BWK80_27700 [Desulfobacteraceae bacterium IS3]